MWFLQFSKRMQFKAALEKAHKDGWTQADAAQGGVVVGSILHPIVPPSSAAAMVTEFIAADASAGDDTSTTSLPPAPPVYSFTEEDLQGIIHLAACWERYQEIDGDAALLEADFKAAQVERWMSGLACCRNELCSAVYDCIVPPTEPDGKPKKFYNDPKDCPPGCGCDNPWPFTGNAVPMVPPKPSIFTAEEKS